MSDSTEEIRAEIARKRAELGQDVDALADKVTPSKIVHRQTDKMRGALSSVRNKVMGAVDDAGSSIGSAGSSVGDGISQVGDGLSHAKDRAQSKAEGNPLAVGLIALGAGLLVSSLIPASSKEKQLASDVKEKAQPLVDEASSVAKEVGANLKEPAQDAAAAVKDKATEGAEHVRDDATQAKDEVSGRAQEARSNLSGS